MTSTDHQLAPYRRGLGRLADPARFGAWLLAIAANRARMALRRRRLLAVHELPLDSPVPSSAAGADLQPEDVWASREIHEEIMAALRELPAATRFQPV
jgi:DNA-directed RNA polymerase specialized sigma24 family protein